MLTYSKAPTTRSENVLLTRNVSTEKMLMDEHLIQIKHLNFVYG